MRIRWPILARPNLQNQSIAQYRTLTNAGAHADLTYTAGNQSIKGGAMFTHTFLREHDSLGLVNPTFNSPCVNALRRSGQWIRQHDGVRCRGIRGEPCIPTGTAAL